MLPPELRVKLNVNIMKKSILSLALVALTFCAFAVQTPSAAKKVHPRMEKKAAKAAKKDTVTVSKSVKRVAKKKG